MFVYNENLLIALLSSVYSYQFIDIFQNVENEFIALLFLGIILFAICIGLGYFYSNKTMYLLGISFFICTSLLCINSLFNFNIIPLLTIIFLILISIVIFILNSTEECFEKNGLIISGLAIIISILILFFSFLEVYDTLEKFKQYLVIGLILIITFIIPIIIYYVLKDKTITIYPPSKFETRRTVGEIFGLVADKPSSSYNIVEDDILINEIYKSKDKIKFKNEDLPKEEPSEEGPSIEIAKRKRYKAIITNLEAQNKNDYIENLNKYFKSIGNKKDLKRIKKYNKKKLHDKLVFNLFELNKWDSINFDIAMELTLFGIHDFGTDVLKKTSRKLKKGDPDQNFDIISDEVIKRLYPKILKGFEKNKLKYSDKKEFKDYYDRINPYIIHIDLISTISAIIYTIKIFKRYPEFVYIATRYPLFRFYLKCILKDFISIIKVENGDINRRLKKCNNELRELEREQRRRRNDSFFIEKIKPKLMVKKFLENRKIGNRGQMKYLRDIANRNIILFKTRKNFRFLLIRLNRAFDVLRKLIDWEKNNWKLIKRDIEIENQKPNN